MNEELDALLASSAAGLAAITRIGHAGDIKASIRRLIALAEMKKRGVRFLPNQAIKRSLRKHRVAGL